MASEQVLDRIRNLNMARVSGKRAPHKPLLILVALGAWQRGIRDVPFPLIEATLLPLLKAWAPPTKSRPQPELPYWYMRSDGLWQVHQADQLECKSSGFPTLAALRQSSAAFTADVQEWLDRDDSALLSMAWLILEQHFLPSTYEALLDQCGLDIPLPFSLQPSSVINDPANAGQRYRTAGFRREVLQAYDYRCAVSGLQIWLGGTEIACEAAHVMAHAFGGPDSVDNGLALEPTLHLLFDRGIWSLSDDRRILVSQDFTGSDAGLERIRSLSGQRIRDPKPGQPLLNPEYIRWHREANAGGVFRAPALPW